MPSFFVAPIVGGHGEVQAARILLERILGVVREDSYLEMNSPLRVKESSFFNDSSYLAKYVTLAALKARSHANPLVLVLLDSEDDCPATLGPRLQSASQAVFPSVPVLVNLAYREYETWFLAAARSLRGVAGLPADLEPPPNPESIRDAKSWLGQHMDGYNPPNDQPSLTQAFSFQEANSISSFQRLHTKLMTFFQSDWEGPPAQ